MVRVKWLFIVLIILLTCGGAGCRYNEHPEEKDIPALIARLQIGIPDVQEAAAYELGLLGPSAKDAAPYLIDLLDSHSNDVRAQSASSLGFIGPVPGVSEALIDALNDTDPYVVYYAARALGNLGPLPGTAPALIERYGTADETGREGIVMGLSSIGSEPGVTDLIIQAMEQDENYRVRLKAAQGLAHIGPEPGVITALIRALEDESGTVSAAGAAYTLGKLGPQSAEAVPALVNAFTTADDIFRPDFARALGQIGPGAAEAVPILIDALDSEKYDIAYDAAIALANIGPEPGVVEALTEMLASHRAWAAEALGIIGAPAIDALPELQKQSLDVSDLTGRLWATYAIMKIDPASSDSGLACIISGLNHDDKNVRHAAVEVLAYFVDEPGVVEALISALDDEDTAVMFTAVFTLSEIGPRAATALPKLKTIKMASNGPGTIQAVKYAIDSIEAGTGQTE
jgi:HEAT repeat protein